MNTYGKELILDLSNCDTKLFNRKDLTRFFEALCESIDMEREDLHFWDYEDDPEGYNEAPPHLKGTSAVQFIRTSNITIHTLDELKRLYINVFSCKDFDSISTAEFIAQYFEGKIDNLNVIARI